MYQPPIFKTDDTDEMHRMMQAFPFATLVTSSDGLSADHLPLVLHPEASPNGTLRGHVAAVNPLCKSDSVQGNALAVFHGPNAYISPSWYPSKQEHGKVVPTWNYVAVHAKGHLTFRTEPDWLIEHLRTLSHQHEGAREHPWAPEDAPADFVTRQLKLIVGIEITIHELSGKWKVSQNRSEADRNGAADGVSHENETMAALIRSSS